MARLIKRKLAPAPEIVMLSHPRSVAAEKFRRIKTLLAHAPEGSPQVIVVTSAGPGEGKTFTSVNLAMAFAADGQGEVLLVDADLRRPSVDAWLSPPPRLGLSDLLTGQTELDHAVLDLENVPMKVLPAGAPPPDASELLASEFSRALFDELRRRFQRIIVDTPPLVPFTDADVIGGLSDGVLIVARAGKTRTASYLETISSVSSTRILGTILNDLIFNLADRERYSHYERGYYEYYGRDRE